MRRLVTQGKHGFAKRGRWPISLAEGGVKTLGDGERRSISDRPQRGDEAACACCMEGACKAAEFLACVNGMSACLATGEEDEVGIEPEVDDVAKRQPAVGELGGV